MKLIIGSMDHKLQHFIKQSKFSERMLLINKMCNVKSITSDVDVIIPFGIITNTGLISNTFVHLEELIITLNVKKIYYSNPYNLEILNNLSKKYNFEVEYFSINSPSQNFFF